MRLVPILAMSVLMHFWANDDALKLVKGLRAALDKSTSAGES